MSKVFYCYSDYQQSFEKMTSVFGDKIQFVKGFSGHAFFTENELEDRNEHSDPILLCLDDCIEDLLKQKDALTIFTRCAGLGGDHKRVFQLYFILDLSITVI